MELGGTCKNNFDLILIGYPVCFVVLSCSSLLILSALTWLPKDCPVLFHVKLFCLVGSAGLGVLSMAVQAVSRMSGGSGTDANSQFFLIDKDVCLHCLYFLC